MEAKGWGGFLGLQLKGPLFCCPRKRFKVWLLVWPPLISHQPRAHLDGMQQETEASRATHAFVFFIFAALSEAVPPRASSALPTPPSGSAPSLGSSYLQFEVFCLLVSLKIQRMGLVFIFLAVLYGGKIQN